MPGVSEDQQGGRCLRQVGGLDGSPRTLQVTKVLESTLSGMGATQGLGIQEARELACVWQAPHGCCAQHTLASGSQ